MGNYEQLRSAVSNVIKTNGTQSITGQIMQNVLLTIISTIGENATFAGIAEPTTSPGTPDGPLFYIAYEKGIYVNFNAIDITDDDGLVILLYSSDWSKINIPLASKDELVQVRSDLSVTTDKLTELEDGINGERIEEEIVQTAEVIVSNARILRQTSVVDYLPLTTSASLNLYFFPIINGGKYRFIIKNSTASTAYWGYANEVVESIAGNVNLQGKLIEMTTPTSENPIFEKTIESAEDFRYIVICGYSVTFYNIISHREGGVIEKLDSIENGLTGIKEKVIGEPVEVEQEVSSIKEMLSARIEATGIQETFIRFSTSTNTRMLKFYPIEKGKKYKIYSSYISAFTAYWGYTNEIPDSITEKVTCDGMCPFVPVPTAGQNIEYIIDAAEDYGYIAISAPTSAFDSGTAKLCEIVEQYVGGIDDIKREVEQNTERIEVLESKENSTPPLDIANGNLDESCLVENQADYYVGYHSVIGGRKSPDANEDIVVIAHDDLPAVDYIGVRKIYNKYNFQVTFNYILAPFTSVGAKNTMIENIKKMIADGHEIGFHACLGSSFFWRNPMFDITSSGNATFAPTLSELKTDIGGGNNIFGKSVASATFSTMGYSGDSATKSVLLANATSTQWLDAHRFYTIYGTRKTISGLDLEDNYVTKTYLGWLEYWYNNLIDDTLGYSSEQDSLSARFAEDYQGTYPTASAIESGSLTSFGTFKKGLFKGCHSCCNFEVIDRILMIAEAFVQKFFGLAKFTNAAYHGVDYINLFWKGADGVLYNNRDKSILASGYTKLYSASKDRTMNLFDLLLAHGIVMLKKVYPDDAPRLEGQIGLIKGQKNVRGSFFNDFSSYYHTNTDQTSVIAKSSSSVSDNITLAELKNWMPEHYEDWLKYAYEHSGEDLSDSRGTMYMRTYIKDTIDKIRSARGTGKIAFLGVDTIKLNSSQMAAVELICQYCYRHNIRMVSSHEGMVISNNDRIISGNLFPNPSFRQTLLDDFGGSSTSISAYIPDGWYSLNSLNYTLSVENDNGNKVLHLSATNRNTLSTRVYGLSGGKYKFSAMLKTTNADPTCVIVCKKLNSDSVGSSSAVIEYLNATNEYKEITCEFNIPEPHKNAPNGTLPNTLCNGYEDNVAFIEIKMIAESGKETWMYNPKLVFVE